MKKLLDVDWLQAALPGRLPFPGKKTPWYRQILQQPIWVAGALVAPFALFLAWMVISKLLMQPVTEEQQ